jgi:DGQHR domain-containing protein
MAASEATKGLEFEGRVRGSLKRIGFKDIGGGPAFKVGGHQIDCCGGWDDVLLIVECTQSATGGASIRNLISEVRGKQGAVKAGFRRLKGYEPYRRFVFAVATKNITYTDGDRELADQKPKVHLIDEQVLLYYERLEPLIHRGALFNFLGELEIEPRDVDFPRLPAFRARLGKEGPVYLFWCEPHELFKIAYVARRESGLEHYYQRLLRSERLKGIRKYIDDGGVFPNNVIVGFDRKPTFRPKAAYDEGWPGWLEFGELLFPKSYRSAWVIDGQHRLYSFASKHPNPQAQKLAVLAFEGLSLEKQAKFFIDINHEQKPVSEDLILDLEGDLRPDTDRGTIANCIKQLNAAPPLKDKIFLPLAGERPRGQLKISGLYIDFRETELLNERTHNMTQAQKNPLAAGAQRDLIPGRAAKAVSEFLTDVEECACESLWKGVVLRPGGITLALHVYEQVLCRLGRAPTDQERQKYARAFTASLHDLAPSDDRIRDLRNDLTSYTQRRQTLLEILLRMQEELDDREFAKTGLPADRQLERLIRFERKLAEFVASALGISTMGDLRQKAPEGVWRRVDGIVRKERKTDAGFAVHQAFGLGDIRQIIERRDNAEDIMPLFVEPTNGFASEQGVLSALDEINRARVMAHGRRRGNRALVTACVDAFELLMGS